MGEKKIEPKFTADQLAHSKRFHDEQDLIYAVLEKGKEYTIQEAEDRIHKYLKGKVN